MKDFVKSIKTCNNIVGNKKVKNGSGHWGRGGADVYKDNSNPGISASIRQVGKGFEVLYTDTYKKISGKSVGIYPDKDTAKDVAEAVVETEMPDSVKANYRSKAVNARIGNIDQRIPAFKTKLQNLAKQGDIGAIKDVERFVEDMIKDIGKQQDEAYKTLKVLGENRQGYIDLRVDIVNALLEAEKNK